MAALSSLDKRKLEKFLGMGGGYVLDFTNRTFAEFFTDNVATNIYDQKYSLNGDSKANRMRTFWAVAPDQTVGKVLIEMLKCRKYLSEQHPENFPPGGEHDVQEIAQRLLGILPQKEVTEADFLAEDFGTTSFKVLQVEPSVIPILEARYAEAVACYKAKAYLSVIFMCGSVLEGALLGAAQKNPKGFNQCPSSPKDDAGKVKQYHMWRLWEFIEVASSIGLLGTDVKKFSHALREFRNYIHPYEQMANRFAPDEHTAKICIHVLKAALADLTPDTENT